MREVQIGMLLRPAIRGEVGKLMALIPRAAALARPSDVRAAQ